MDLNHYVDEEMDGSSGYSYEESDVTDYSDDQAARGGSGEVERGGQPELPAVRIPPERPPDDANANVWHDYNMRMNDWNEVQQQDIQESFRRMHRRAMELDRDGDHDAADRLRDEIYRIQDSLWSCTE